MKKNITWAIAFFLMALVQSARAQINDACLIKELEQSGYIHRPLPLNKNNSVEYKGLRKKVINGKALCTDVNLWKAYGPGKLEKENDKAIKLIVPREVKDWSNSDHAVYGYTTAVYPLSGSNWNKYNRISFRIYPDCEGPDELQLSLYLYNDGKLKIPDEYGREGSHEIHVRNHQWNDCFLEIAELPRDKMKQLAFGVTSFGRDRGMSANLCFKIKDIRLEQIENPEHVSGWIPSNLNICYSTSGYPLNGEKIALMNTNNKIQKFQLIDEKGKIVFEQRTYKQKSTIGEFTVLDFSSFKNSGTFMLQIGNIKTLPFRIGTNVWNNSVARVLNFIFCERCGYAVPGIHSSCHADIIAAHNGRSLSFCGGWHDAGDMSQQALQTGEVVFDLLEVANKMKNKDINLYYRLREEAEWGLDFVLKCRFGDGYRATSVGMGIWTDNLLGTQDDTPARVHNHPFDNFLLGGIEAYAAMSINDDNMLKCELIKAAKEDFEFAMKEHLRTGFRPFIYFWEHSYNTSESQYMATASWAASMIYKLTNNQYYADKAKEFIDYVLICQRIEPLKDKDNICGFFYRDKSKKIITHFNHQSREQIYMQALCLLCETQSKNPDYMKWRNAIILYASYLKKIVRYTLPYGMIPSGVYGINEAKDSLSFNVQHLMAGKNAVSDYIAQLKQGIKLDEGHYLKIFPVWFSFRGNNAVLLSMGKAAAICANYLHDSELSAIAERQLEWIVGKNPFGQSLIYGEGQHYTQQYAALPGEMTGEISVGIQTKYNEDKPYWPQENNATYKEVWLTSAGKWLSLVSELINNH